MTDTTSTRSQEFQEFSGKWFDRLVKGTAQVYGNRPADAVTLSPDEELRLWRRPTSPAAQKAYELGGTDEDAERANSLWAHAMRGQQQITRQQLQAAGAAEEDIHAALVQQGLTDELIFATCRRDAFNLGRQNSRNSPKHEVAYHKRLAEKDAAERAKRLLPSYATTAEAEGV